MGTPLDRRLVPRPVRHQEILLLLDRGVQPFAAARMGRLRVKD
ncbi:hypothetical protein [Streptomyces sp. NPDC004685]